MAGSMATLTESKAGPPRRFASTTASAGTGAETSTSNEGRWRCFYCPRGRAGTSRKAIPCSASALTSKVTGRGIINFINKKDQGRDAASEFGLHFYDINRYTPKLNFKPIVGRWHKGEWHHLAMVWDRNQGITIYEDGKRADSNWGEVSLGLELPIPRMLVLGHWQLLDDPVRR